MTPYRNIGSSLLASTPPPSHHDVRALPDLDTHGLFLDGQLIAVHPNGYSCLELAKRMQAKDRYLEQAQYILDCGGLVVSMGRLRILCDE